jgi:hypothetical protein
LEDRSTRLFNSITHVYSSVGPQPLEEVEEEVSEMAEIIVRDNDGAVLVEESTTVEKDTSQDIVAAEIHGAMEEMTFGDSNVEVDVVDDENVVDGVHRFCKQNIWKKGWEAIATMDVKESRERDRKRRDRKKKVSKYCIERSEELKDVSSALPIGEEKVDVEAASWTDYVHSLRPDFYK